MPPVRQFYRRPLPSLCTDFASDKGKSYFANALLTGNANIYFKLAAQFRTQEEPAFCGLSTMVMVLNALAVDPGRLWKGPWRWYHESMLDCCQPLTLVKEKGITFAQFVCLAVCNRLKANAVYVDGNRGADEEFADFVTALTASVRSEEEVMVVTYDRASLGQTGSGHFSPVAAFDTSADQVLIMDVARFKYPPHWVDTRRLFDAMSKVDATTGRSRGYVLLTQRTNERPLIMFRIAPPVDVVPDDGRHKLDEWNDVLKTGAHSDDDDRLRSLFRVFVGLLDGWCTMLCLQGEAECCGEEGEEERQDTATLQKCCRRALANLLSTPPAITCKEELRHSAMSSCRQTAFIMLFISWPYEGEEGTDGGYMRGVCEGLLQSIDDVVRNDVEGIRYQLRVINAQTCCTH